MKDLLENDQALAAFMQAEFSKESKEQELKEMLTSTTGKAWKMVFDLLEQIKAMQTRFGGSGVAFSHLATDDLVWLVDQLLKKQEELKAQNISTHVDIGIHYTKPENLTRIRTDGLLSAKERTDRKIASNFNGAAYGDGIYTCDNPTTYRNQAYGNIGLIVARLKGKTSSVIDTDTYYRSPLCVLRSSNQVAPLLQFTGEPGTIVPQCQQLLQLFIDPYLNIQPSTLIAGTNAPPPAFTFGNPAPATGGFSFGVPSVSLALAPVPMFGSTTGPPATSSFGAPTPAPLSGFGSQPMGLFGINPIAANLAPNPAAATTILFGAPAPAPNSGVHSTLGAAPFTSTFGPRTFGGFGLSSTRTASSRPAAQTGAFYNGKTLSYNAPDRFNHDAMRMISVDVTGGHSADDECCICLDSLTMGTIGCIQVCGHKFHYPCIQAAVAQNSRCPLCSANLVDPQGTMPSGTMKISLKPGVACSGYPMGTIEMSYSIPSGMQKSYHR